MVILAIGNADIAMTISLNAFNAVSQQHVRNVTLVIIYTQIFQFVQQIVAMILLVIKNLIIF